jgi:tetratricopeptide (TPR) repeat protein
MGAINLVYLNDQESAEKAWDNLQKKYPQFDLAKEFFDYAQRLQDEGKFELAIRLYDEISKFFPEGPNREKALFLKGFVYSEELKDYSKAKEIYRQFLQDYPESELRDDAEYMLENMDKEPELGK